MTEKLFTPLVLRNITLPSRSVRSATELFCSTPDAHVRESEINVYRELADASLGLIITAHTCVAPEGRSNDYQTAIWSDDYLEESAAIAAAASAKGTPVIMQIGHGGMKAEGHNGGRRVYTPDNMSAAEITGLIRDFGAAARRAKQAGFAGIMLHAAHRYLLSQFFYPEYNHRADKYGGTAENRFRVVMEIYEEIKKVCGDSFPVFMKLNGDDRDDTAQYHNDVVTALNMCDKAGMDAVEISGWQSAPRGKPKAPYFIENIRTLRGECGIPLIAVGGIRNGADIDALFAAGTDAVSMARPLIQDPGIISKLRNGGESGCVGCGKCSEPISDDTDPRFRCPMRGR